MAKDPGDDQQTEREEKLERRSFVALLFADLSDYTALGESRDPEEIIELRHEVEGIARTVIGGAGGEINQFTGDGILAVFGLMEPDEDALRHAVEASIDLHQAIRGSQWKTQGLAGFTVRFHSGVHSGLVFARRGDPLHGKYELTGDTVNTAARLCSVAQRDEILVSATALRGFESYFDIEPVAPLTLKGKQHPVSAYRVKGRSDIRSRFEARSRRGLTPFVGRVALLDRIEQELTGADAPAGGALCLVGDAGLGKTRLLNEVAQRALSLGYSVHHGGCESYGGVVPLRPFLQIVSEGLPVTSAGSAERAAEDVERRLIELDPALTSHLSAFLHLFAIEPWSFDDGARDSQVAVISALTDLLLVLARRQPTLLLLDDWQWADSGSAQVLGRLLRALPQVSLRILVGARAIDPHDAVLARVAALELQPFTEQESLELVASLAHATIDPHAAQRVHLRSGGNPLFLEELCGTLLPDLPSPDALSAEVPATLNGLIHARIARLEQGHARVLRGASVIGNEFATWLLEEVVSHPSLHTVLGELAGSGLLYAGSDVESFRFKHGITRDVVYESVRLHERRELHGRIARALEHHFAEAGLVDQYERLASHYAGAADYARALDFANLAGDKAALASALDSARVQYAAALAHIDHLGTGHELRRRWLEIAAKWARACIFNPALDQLPILARAIDYAEELGDETAVAHAEYWVGWIEYALGDQDTAIRHLRRASSLAERAGDQPLLAQLYLNLGQSYAASLAYGPALECLSRGIEMRRARAGTRPGSTPVGLAYALGCQALVVGDRGEFSTAYALINEGFDLVRDTGNAVEGSLFCLRGMLQLWQGRWHEAVETASAGRVTAERVIGPYVLAMCRLIGGYARFRVEGSVAALDELRGAVDWLERRDMGLYLSFGLGHVADALLEAGEHAPARDYADRALLRAKQTDPIGSAMAHRTLARLALMAGQEQRAREHCEDALCAARARGSERELALTHLALGELELGLEANRALPLLERASADFDRMRMSWHLVRARARLDHCRALLRPS
jgi:class 3 adenylate cyclase/tetratricopeptide (TPR) repeat protein